MDHQIEGWTSSPNLTTNSSINMQSNLVSSDSQALLTHFQYAAREETDQHVKSTMHAPSNRSINDESRDRIGHIPTFGSGQSINQSIHSNERFSVPNQSNSYPNWPSNNPSTSAYRDFSVSSTAEPSPHGSVVRSTSQSTTASNNASNVSSPSSLNQSLNSRTQSLSFSGSNGDSRRASGSSTPLTQPSIQSNISSNIQSNNQSPHQSSPQYFVPTHATGSPSHMKSESDNHVDDDEHVDELSYLDSDHQSHSRISRRSESPGSETSSDRGPSCVIECGRLNNDGERIYHETSAYFNNQSVEVYLAANDPRKRTLYRAAQLSEKFNCATNKVGMYLARRRNQIINSQAENPGLYQATSFRAKPSGRSGLKAGGYFVSIEVCRAFQRHFETQLQRKRKATQNNGANDLTSNHHSQPAQRVAAPTQYQQPQQFSQAINTGSSFSQYPNQSQNGLQQSQVINSSTGGFSGQSISQPPANNPDQVQLLTRLHILQQLQQQGMMQNSNQVMSNAPSTPSFSQVLNDTNRVNNFYNPSMMNQQYSAAANNQPVQQYGANNSGWGQYPTPSQPVSQYPTDNQYVLNQQTAQYTTNNQIVSPSTSINQPMKQQIPGLAVMPMPNQQPYGAGPPLSNQLKMGPVLTPMNQSMQPNQPANQQSRPNTFSFTPGAQPTNNPQSNPYQSGFVQSNQYNNGMSSQFYAPNQANVSTNQFSRFPPDVVSPANVSPVPINSNQLANRQNNLAQVPPSRPPSSQFGPPFNSFM